MQIWSSIPKWTKKEINPKSIPFDLRKTNETKAAPINPCSDIVKFALNSLARIDFGLHSNEIIEIWCLFADKQIAFYSKIDFQLLFSLFACWCDRKMLRLINQCWNLCKVSIIFIWHNHQISVSHTQSGHEINRMRIQQLLQEFKKEN